MVRHDSAGSKATGKPNGTPVSKKADRQSVVPMERPSKDGSAQKAASEVEGLKGYVSISVGVTNSGHGLIQLQNSNWEIVSEEVPLALCIKHSIGVLVRRLLLSKSNWRICQRVSSKLSWYV